MNTYQDGRDYVDGDNECKNADRENSTSKEYLNLNVIKIIMVSLAVNPTKVKEQTEEVVESTQYSFILSILIIPKK